MQENERNQGFADVVTAFAIKQVGRRSILKWLGKGGLLFAGLSGGIGAELVEQSHAALASTKPKPNYVGPPPPCTGACRCDWSDCITSGAKCSCVGVCDPCNNYKQVEATITWYFAGTKYLPECNCYSC